MRSLCTPDRWIARRVSARRAISLCDLGAEHGSLQRPHSPVFTFEVRSHDVSGHDLTATTDCTLAAADACRRTVRGMRVAMLGPIAWRTPPVHYGPWELVTSLLTEGLVARGVDVTLFATLDSQTAATLDGVARTATPRTDDGRAGVGSAARLARACPLGRVRPRAQPAGLATARVRRALSGHRW